MNKINENIMDNLVNAIDKVQDPIIRQDIFDALEVYYTHLINFLEGRK